LYVNVPARVSFFVLHQSDLSPDLETLPKPTIPPTCTILKDELCTLVSVDSWGLTITIWTTLQLIWVTMLLIVQLLQIARAMTTYEAMTVHKVGGGLSHHGHSHGPPAAAERLTSFLTTGAPDMAAGSIDPANRGPDPAAAHKPPQRLSCMSTWYRLLGIDTFMATAFRRGDGHGHSHANGECDGHSHGASSISKNPFSRGFLQNCADFWYDDSPVFGSRENGFAKLGGAKVDYTALYDVPTGGRGSGGYLAVAADDDV
jgi:hypothetical protein